MKVGIITYHNAYSYGAQLQAYALQEVVRMLGHEPWIIDFKGIGFDNPGVKDFLPVLERPWRLPEVVSQYNEKKAFLEFAKFQHRTRLYSLYQELMSNPPAFEAYICGSDQIWQPKDLKDGRAIQDEYFLSFVNNGGKKIAYAPSFGTLPSEDFVRRISPLLRRLDHISVREESMRDIVGGVVGHSVPTVCDPTLLLGRAGFSKLLPPDAGHKQGAFFYPLTLNLPRDKKICLHLEETYGSLEIVARNWHLWFVGSNVTLSPIEWMRRIRDAKFVLTNSFHGTAFSILFHKPFITLNWLKDSQNIRVRSMLARLGLEDRFFDGANVHDFSRIVERAVDWAAVDEKLSCWRWESMDFLRKALQ